MSARKSSKKARAARRSGGPQRPRGPVVGQQGAAGPGDADTSAEEVPSTEEAPSTESVDPPGVEVPEAVDATEPGGAHDIEEPSEHDGASVSGKDADDAAPAVDAGPEQVSEAEDVAPEGPPPEPVDDVVPEDLEPEDVAIEDLEPEDLEPEDLEPEDVAPHTRDEALPKGLGPEDVGPEGPGSGDLEEARADVPLAEADEPEQLRTEDDETPADDAQPEEAEAAEVQPLLGGSASAVPSRRAWRRLGRAARPRPTKANVLATVLAVSLGFAIAAQVRQTSIEGLEDLREDELIRILDTVDQDGSRLAEEIQTLTLSRDRLRSDTTSLAEARKAAQQRLDSLAILTGTAPARGPGIVLTIRDPEFGVTAPMLLDTLQELRDAGAEAVEINNIRIVANTYFTDGEGGIAISGTPVSAPYVITAIGDGSTLASAMEIPGGVTNTVRSVGGEAGVETKDEVIVSALQSVSEPQYARPVPSPTTS